MKFAKTAATLLIIGLAVTPLAAKDKNKNHGHGRDEQSSDSSKSTEVKKFTKADTKFAISVKEREVIQTYVNNFNEEGKRKNGKKHHGELPPGLQKKVERGGQLPPGWQKKVAVGETMPVEVFKECKPLPKDLIVKLPSPPAGTITVTVDGKIVRLMEATKQILDVFEVPVPFLTKR